MLPNLKDKSMKMVFDLLESKSEQERRLLTALVNKLGDPERRAASSAAFLLTRLLSVHPNMKMVVIDEVDSFLCRPHVGLRAKYQAVNFLSQIFLTNKGDGPKIAKRLVDVYIALFKVLMSSSRDTKGYKHNKHGKKTVENGKAKGRKDKVNDSISHGNHEVDPSARSDIEMDSRILSALLTGVNRALPYVASSEVDDIVEVQTPILFRLVHSENFNVGVQSLMLLYQISAKNQIASDRFYRALYAKLLSPAAVSSSKPELFLGLLVKAMKNDLMFKRVAAFSKRLLQVALQQPPQYVCGCLFILSEVLKAKPPLWAIVLQSESVDDDIEHFEDIVESTDNPAISSTMPDKHNDILATQKYNSDTEGGSDNINQVKLVDGDEKDETNASTNGSTLHALYNPRHREPSYCNADRVSWWELTLLASHVHPSVSTMARTLLSGNNIVYNGDPLTDLSLPAFLDKFMEKKPKGNRIAEGKWHGGSQIAPAKKLDLNHHLIGEELLELAENEVPPEDVVFHRFYMNKTGPIKHKAKKKASVIDDDTGELLADDVDDATDESDDEMEELGDGLTEDGEYDYDNMDAEAFEEEGDLLRYDSDVELDGISDDSASRDGGMENDDDEDGPNISCMDAEALESADDSDDNISNGDAARGQKRKHGAKGGASPFARLEDYEHLMDGDAEKPTSKKLKHKVTGDSVGGKEKPNKLGSQKRRLKRSE